MPNEKAKPPAQGPVDVNVRQQATDALSLQIATKTDEVLREAVTRFLGTDKWATEELKDRGVMQHFQSGVEVFCLDGVALVELYPLAVEYETKGGSVVINATRRHRFLMHNQLLDRPFHLDKKDVGQVAQ